MQKKIEYVSEKLVKDELKSFKNTTLLAIEQKISEQYMQYFPHSLLHAVKTAVWSNLSVSLYMTSSDFKQIKPSFRQQICAIHDFRNLLRGENEPLRFFDEVNYYTCYTGINTLLNEKKQFQQTQKISEEFWRELGSAYKENLEPEHAELFLRFVEEMTRALTEATLNMLSEQIQNMFPDESERYQHSLDSIYGSSINTPSVTTEQSAQLKTTKVKFSL